MTVEEKAKKYADDVAFLVPYDGTMNFYDEKRLKTAEIDYLAGHNEAMRWRDPKIELPNTGESVLVKYRTAKKCRKARNRKVYQFRDRKPLDYRGFNK